MNKRNQFTCTIKFLWKSVNSMFRFDRHRLPVHNLMAVRRRTERGTWFEFELAIGAALAMHSHSLERPKPRLLGGSVFHRVYRFQRTYIRFACIVTVSAIVRANWSAYEININRRMAAGGNANVEEPVS